MADYLERYARRFELPVRNGVRVDAVGREDGRFIVAAGDAALHGRQRRRRHAARSAAQDARLRQRARSAHRAGALARVPQPGQLQDGAVLLVGAGNSGADIALDLPRAHMRPVGGRHLGHIPINITGLLRPARVPAALARVVACAQRRDADRPQGRGRRS